MSHADRGRVSYVRKLASMDIWLDGIDLESVSANKRCAFCGHKQDPPRLQRGTGLCVHCVRLKRLYPKVVR